MGRPCHQRAQRQRGPKTSIFVAPKNGVEYCQCSNGTTRSSLTTSYDFSRRRAMALSFNQSEAEKLSHTHRYTENRHTVRPCSTSSACKNTTKPACLIYLPTWSNAYFPTGLSAYLQLVGNCLNGTFLGEGGMGRFVVKS